MIRIDFSLAVALYLLLILVLVACAWVIFEHRLKTKGGLNIWHKNNVWHCSVCTYTYLDKEAELSICPRCKSYNKREDKDTT